jgi:hypothetical protein
MLEAAQEGASDVELRCLIGVASTAWYTLIGDDQDFCKTVSFNAKSKSTAKRLAVRIVRNNEDYSSIVQSH